MGLLIGMDEAGYGPNLGPLVITVTAWDVPDPPAKCDLWKCFAKLVSQDTPNGNGRLHLADSKKVYNPAIGLGRLEETVLAAFQLSGLAPPAFHDLCEHLIEGGDGSCRSEPCVLGAHLPLPHVTQLVAAVAADRWRKCCERHGVRLRAIRSEIVWPRRWNGLNRENANKAETLTRLTLRLLRRVWSPDSDEPALVVADKHGGRNRYDGYLQEIADGAMIFRLREAHDVSRYRIGAAELRFQAGGEAHLPVALASMVSKYVRELSMELFNRFWAAHVPDVKPTKGYPVDAHRFRLDIAEAQQRLNIPDAVLWRER